MNELRLMSDRYSSTARDYFARMGPEKANDMVVAKRYGHDYWDGQRRFGYGGYRYLPGWFSPVVDYWRAEANLCNTSRVLDLGCGKGCFLYEVQSRLPGASLVGLDVSPYAVSDRVRGLEADLRVYDLNVNQRLPFDDKYFDLTVSTCVLHNLSLSSTLHTLSEIERVSKNSYVTVESYENERQQVNLQCWALTANLLLSKSDWLFMMELAGYKGSYEFLIFD